MPRGGARLNSGPPPDPNALRRDRRDDKAGWTMLPASGRQGDPPNWPLPPDVGLTSQLQLAESQREVLEAQIDSGDEPRGAHAKLSKLDQVIARLKAALEAAVGMEAELWKALWSTPQAVAWDQLRWTREVALYARLQVKAELGDLDAGKEARQWSDRLGLNPTALLRNRWKIDGVAEAGPAPQQRTPSQRRAKSRMKVIQGGAQGGSA